MNKLLVTTIFILIGTVGTVLVQRGTVSTSKKSYEEKISFYNEKLQWIAHSGEFNVMIGGSAADIKLQKEICFRVVFVDYLVYTIILLNFISIL